MKKTLTLIFVVIGFSSIAQNCNEVKTGTYVIENKNYGGSLLIRTEFSQEEIVENLGIHTKFDLIWTDECNYVLFNRNVIKKGGYEFPEAKTTDSLFVEITDITPKGYTFQASSNFSDFVTNGTAKRKI